MLDVVQVWLARPNFIAFVVLFLWGLYITVTHHNFVKRLIGLYLVQTSVVFFLVTTSAKRGATVPILLSTTEAIQADTYVNPLPHVLTLTAIVNYGNDFLSKRRGRCYYKSIYPYGSVIAK
jgi:multicomponent Na+:H+ antiporter subunit C